MLAVFLSAPRRARSSDAQESFERKPSSGMQRFLDNIFTCLTVAVNFLGSSISAILGPLFVTVAIVLITFIIFLYFYLILPAYFDSWNILSLSHLGIAFAFIYNIGWNYYAVITTPPGHPPASVPESLVHSGQFGKYAKWCHECKSVKPERAHHCHVCGHCVLKMDHHCPWINNCVGYYNHRYFVLFLCWLGMGALYVCVLCFPFATVDPTAFNAIANADMAARLAHWRGTVMFAFIITLAVGGALMLYFCWHLFLVVTQQTTIEFYLNRFEAGRLRKQGVAFQNPYSFGMRENFEEFFDTKRHAHQMWWFFLLPSPPPTGDGMLFRMRAGSEPPQRFHVERSQQEVVDQA